MDLLGAGRDCDVFDLGDGTVLRRRRSQRRGLAEREAAAMTHARAHGFPCPAVHGVDGGDLVMDRVDGPSMLASLIADPTEEAGRDAGFALADLHCRLHAVPPMRGGDGCLLHLDLHPDNVLVSEVGPVVIDWTNAADGPAGLDLAMTWLIVAPVAAEGLPVAVALLDAFLDAAGRQDAVAHLGEAGRRRLADPNVTDGERAAVRAVLAAEGVDA